MLEYKNSRLQGQIHFPWKWTDKILSTKLKMLSVLQQEDKTPLQQQSKHGYVLVCIKISIILQINREGAREKNKLEAHNLSLLPSQDQEFNNH
jgi:hypothetical protein